MYQADKDSLPMQRNDLIAYAKVVLNTTDYVIYEDAGYSGKNTDRPRFQQMMTDIRSGKFTHLLVWKIDRISRNLLDFSSMYKELKDLGVTFVSKNEQFDTSTAIGEAMLKIILVFAELERNMTSERVLATMVSRASSGSWNGGRVPFGYVYSKKTQEFSINEAEARIVKMIHDDYEQVHSLTYVARQLNTMGYTTRSGSLWSPQAVYCILKSPFYCGVYRYNVCSDSNHSKVKDEAKWVTVGDHHPAIISSEQKSRIVSLLDANNKLKARSYHSEHIHVFGGIIYCKNCNKLLWSSPVSKRRHLTNYSKYICPSTRSTNSPHCKSTTDLYVGEFVFNFVLNILNLQSSFDSSMSLSALQKRLLFGSVFNQVDHMDEPSLNGVYNMLNSEVPENRVFGKQHLPKEKNSSERNRLIVKRNKIQRASERLDKAYLYSDDSMNEQDYLIQKNKLNEQLSAIDIKIQSLSNDPWKVSINDDEFVATASKFIIQDRLTNRNYVNYEHLASTTDPSVLQTFVQTIIQSIYVSDGRITSITFKNSLECQFFYIQ